MSEAQKSRRDSPVKYQRIQVAGGVYSLTVHLAGRACTLRVDHVAEFQDAVRVVRQNRPFVALAREPNHLHAIGELPEEDGLGAGRGSEPNGTTLRKCVFNQ